MVDIFGLFVILEVTADVFQVYVFAPDAVNVAVPWVHIVSEFTVMVGSGLTVTVEVMEDVQVAAVPVTV